MLIGYSFFAPADEIARTARGLRTRVVGGTEVSVGSSLPSRLMRLWSQRRRQATVLAPTVPGTPQAPPQGDGQGRLRQELGVELGVSAGVKLAEMAWEEFRRRSRR
ncbi:MAG: hypothetical protein IT410_03435 [Candidatus Doudnabacteria bacterium]|nr:hypothetical protein [Candidatus Doudnabacteria bacterium]